MVRKVTKATRSGRTFTIDIDAEGYRENGDVGVLGSYTATFTLGALGPNLERLERVYPTSGFVDRVNEYSHVSGTDCYAAFLERFTIHGDKRTVNREVG